MHLYRHIYIVQYVHWRVTDQYVALNFLPANARGNPETLGSCDVIGNNEFFHH